MKQTIILAALAMAALSLNAQERRPYSFNAEAGIGITTFINQPTLSLTTDAMPQNTALTPSVTVGLSNGSNTFGLRYSHTSANTAATNLRERVGIHEVSLIYRRSVQVAPRVELFGGMSAGMAVADNELPLDGSRRNIYRYGITLGAEIGMRYHISEWKSLFASIGMSYSAFGGSHVGLPVDYVKHVHGAATTVRTTGGISIGIPPKQKSLNMPATLVRNSKPLQLAHYEK